MLQLQKKLEKKYSFWLASSNYLIGSSSESEIFVENASAKAGEFLIENGEVWIAPYASREIMVNGKEITKKTLVVAGDELIVTGCEFVLASPKDTIDVDIVEELEKLRVKAFTLVPLAGPVEEEVDIEDRLIIGSSPQCGLIINLPKISPQHIEISTMGGVSNLRVLPLNQKVMLNGEEVDHAALEDGDIISFAAIEFSVRRNLPNDDKRKTTVRPVIDDVYNKASEGVPSKASGGQRMVNSHKNEWTNEKIKNSLVNDKKHLNESKNLNRRALISLLLGLVIIGGFYYYVQYLS